LLSDRHTFIYACQRTDVEALWELSGGHVVMGKEELNPNTRRADRHDEVTAAACFSACSAARASILLGSECSASVTETDPDRLSLLPDCRLSSFHRLRDLHDWRPRLRVRLELTQIFFTPWCPSQSLLFRHRSGPTDRLMEAIIARQDQPAQSLSSGTTFPCSRSTMSDGRIQFEL
jgi:hypothetical protein